jgi:hypothetical protein
MRIEDAKRAVELHAHLQDMRALHSHLITKPSSGLRIYGVNDDLRDDVDMHNDVEVPKEIAIAVIDQIIEYTKSKIETLGITEDRG